MTPLFKLNPPMIKGALNASRTFSQSAGLAQKIFQLKDTGLPSDLLVLLLGDVAYAFR